MEFEQINEAGVKHYRAIIEELVHEGITPCVVRLLSFSQLLLFIRADIFRLCIIGICHRSLHDRYGGWLDRKIVNDYVHYAKVPSLLRLIPVLQIKFITIVFRFASMHLVILSSTGNDVLLTIEHL